VPVDDHDVGAFLLDQPSEDPLALSDGVLEGKRLVPVAGAP
jgi:hypothetical protein